MNNKTYGPSRTVPVPSRKPQVPLRFSLVNEEMKSFIKKNEDGIHNLYKDHKGNITIGYGQKIPNVEAIKDYTFYLSEGIKPIRMATEEEKLNAYNKVSALPYGQQFTAKWYDPAEGGVNKSLPNLRIQMPDMEFGLEQHLRREVIPSLQKKSPDFHTFPAPVRTALVDMEYNIGAGRFTRERWKDLYKAIDQRNWRAAADQVHMLDIPDRRNNERKEYMLEADRMESPRRR